MKNKARAVGTIVAAALLIASATLIAMNGPSLRKVLIGLVGILIWLAAWNRGALTSGYRATANVLLNTVIILLALELGAAAMLHLLGPPRTDNIPDYYQAMGFGDEVLHDVGDVTDGYVPFVLWKTRPFESKGTNVDADGNRITPQTQCGEGAYTVFVMGGSTVWGQGVPDWGTIPAYLQQRLTERRSQPVCVRNLGQGGWVSTQGVIELERHLQSGEHPNLVISYDGINDIGAAAEEGVAGNNLEILQVRSQFEQSGTAAPLMRLVTSTRLFSLLERAIPSMTSLRTWPAIYQPGTTDNAALADDIARVYLANYRLVGALAADYGFDYAFFWQPNIGSASKPLTPEEQVILRDSLADFPRTFALLPPIYARIKAATGNHDHLFWIADVFDNEPKWLYLNNAHLGPDGNRQVAERMLREFDQLHK